MSAWRREALRALPDLRETIEASWNPMALWIDLFAAFERAFETSNKNQIPRIVSYALWSLSDQSGKLPNNTSTAVVCAFFEHLADRREYWPLLAHWLSAADFASLRPAFVYSLGEQGAEELEKYYCAARKLKPASLDRQR